MTVAYTAMHGVGGATIERAFDAAGFDPPVVVAEQHVPDGTFPTVSFPNPEEPGAMDLLLDVARRCGRASSRWPTIPTPTASGRPSRSPTVRGGA